MASTHISKPIDGGKETGEETTEEVEEQQK
jgi:hypothetical protein